MQRDVASLLEHGLPSDAPAPIEEPFNPPSEVASLAPEAPEAPETVATTAEGFVSEPVSEVSPS